MLACFVGVCCSGLGLAGSGLKGGEIAGSWLKLGCGSWREKGKEDKQCQGLTGSGLKGDRLQGVGWSWAVAVGEKRGNKINS
nr:hypothetical protein [Tanacetum cinerariifolium]